MDTNTTELSMEELEAANGAGLITGFGGYMIPGRKRKKNETGDEQNDQ